MKTKSNLKHGKTNLLPDRIEREDVRVMISLRMPGSLLDHYRALAKERGVPYQTLIQQVLRDHVGKDDSIAQRLEKLEEEVQKIKRKAG
jgi:predicted DNA binding CopG/RHH family protein